MDEFIDSNGLVNEISPVAKRRQHFAHDVSLSEETHPNYVNRDNKPIQFSCNEDGIHLFIPEIRASEGVGLGVGLDQMFDLITNSKVSEAYLVDFLPEVTLTNRAILELCTHMFEASGKVPQFEEIIRELSLQDNPRLKTILQQLGYNETEINKVNTTASRISPGFEGESISLSSYLVNRSRIAEPGSFWGHSKSNILRLIKMHQDGKLHFITADLAGNKSMAEIANRLIKEGKNLSFAYLSNAENYIVKAGTRAQFAANFSKLPLASNGVCLRTEGGELGSFYRNPRLDMIEHPYQALFGLWHYTVENFRHWKLTGFKKPNLSDHVDEMEKALLVIK